MMEGIEKKHSHWLNIFASRFRKVEIKVYVRTCTRSFERVEMICKRSISCILLLYIIKNLSVLLNFIFHYFGFVFLLLIIRIVLLLVNPSLAQMISESKGLF